jgi:sulfite reductase (NADPH) flavoprotein alpha-component
MSESNALDVKLTVLYGTQSGNSESLAKKIIDEADKIGYSTDVKNIKDLKVRDLANIGLSVIVISTWGEGDPPGDAENFCKELYSAREPDLSSSVLYTVLALGDRSYADFCGCGRRVDESFTKLKANKFLPRQELDVDFETDFNKWKKTLFDKIAFLAA